MSTQPVVPVNSNDALTTDANTSAHPFTAPKPEQLKVMSFEVSSNLLPTPEQLLKISNDWVALGIPSADLTQNALRVAIACYHSGSSTASEISGISTKADLPLRSLIGTINTHTTLRKFCRFFAKLVWNRMIEDNIPPANWSAQGVNPAQKFAAFDFFDGVENSGSLNPVGGLVRPPTADERVAQFAARAHHLFEAANTQSRSASNHVQFTRGRLSGSDPRIEFLPGPE